MSTLTRILARNSNRSRASCSLWIPNRNQAACEAHWEHVQMCCETTMRAWLQRMNWYGNLRFVSAQTDLDPKELRPLLHAEIDKLRDEHLEFAHRFLLEIEQQQVLDDLDDAADDARARGRLTPDRIAEAIAAHRAAHPYR